MGILDYHSFYLVGIKGVAMTALAQCLVDAGKKVTGSDLDEEFVTQEILNKLGLKIDQGFETVLSADIDCVIYTSAHKAQQNPQVQQAMNRQLKVFSHAEALGELFNPKQGIAVCGVGGKSTTSAMIAWILQKAAETEQTPPPSFAIGVGNIPGLNKTGQWNPDSASSFFVAEADEYVTDPAAPSRGEEITPRFSFLKPFVTVCSNLRYDHPDVYKDFEHTQAVYANFFSQIKPNGALIINADDQNLVELAQNVVKGRDRSAQPLHLYSFGESSVASLQITHFESHQGQTISTIEDHQQKYQLTLQIPGKFNAMNAVAALATCNGLGVSMSQGIQFLADFRSTMRRSEFIGEKEGVKYYDDYAHHPNEVKQVIQAFKEWFPDQKLVVAFQSHTYSRTKALLNEFVTAFEDADELVMTDIFPSAREQPDSSISSDLLCAEIQKKFPKLQARNLKTNQALTEFCKTQLHEGDVFITVGAGDIYKVHQMI